MSDIRDETTHIIHICCGDNSFVMSFRNKETALKQFSILKDGIANELRRIEIADDFGSEVCVRSERISFVYTTPTNNPSSRTPQTAFN